jgi:hypothetical protein
MNALDRHARGEKLARHEMTEAMYVFHPVGKGDATRFKTENARIATVRHGGGDRMMDQEVPTR